MIIREIVWLEMNALKQTGELDPDVDLEQVTTDVHRVIRAAESKEEERRAQVAGLNVEHAKISQRP